MNEIARQLSDLATVDQQLEQHAQNVERVQRDAIFEIGRELAAAQELFRYRKDEGGFTGWLARRLPDIPQRSAYRAIEIAGGLSPEMFASVANIKPGVVAEIAKSEPDIQALIAERVAAGEIFTAAKVKEIRKEAAREAAEQASEALAEARQRIEELQRQAAQDANAKREIERLQKVITDYEREIEEYEKSLPTPKEAQQIASKLEGGVVLGSDLKFHSSASAEEKALTADYMTLWAILKEFDRADLPLSGRVVGGCSPAFQPQLLSFCNAALSYIQRLKGDLQNAQEKVDA